jgi:glycosyltransferase 2 family protein
VARRPSRAALIRIGCGALALAGLGAAFATQVTKLSEADWRFSAGWLALAIPLLLGTQWLLCVLWLGLLRRLGGVLPPARARSIWGVSVLGRYVPTGALMVVGRVAMARRDGVPRRVSLASIVYELALTVGGALVVCAGFVVTLQDLAPPVVRWAAPVLGVAALVGLHPRILGPVANRLLRRAGAEPLPVVLPARAVAAYAAGYVGAFVLAGLGTVALARALHPLGTADVPLVAASYAVGFVASMVAFLSPAGLGAREVMQATALAPALPFAVGLAVSVAGRLLQICVEVVFAAVTRVLDRGPRARAVAD